MKILHINCNYITTVLHQTMIETLESRDISNIVFAPTYDKNKTVIVPNKNVIVSQCFKKFDRVNYFHKQTKIIRSLEKNLSVNEFDCIHAYTVFTDGNCAMKLSKKYHIPYLVAVRDTDVNTFFRYMPHLRKKGIEILENASAVIFLSPAYKKQLLDSYIPPEKRNLILKKCYIVPNGIDKRWFIHNHANDHISSGDKLRSKKINAIYVGRISKRKNIITTQKALSILRNRGWDVRFTVVGGIDDTNEYKNIIKDKYTEYLEPKTIMELINIYKRHDIFIMPSHTETFGLVYAEAMSQGLPVIYTRGQGFDGQFPEGRVGYAVNDNDAESIADAIIKITESYEMISQNAVVCARKFNWEDICDKYKKIYQEIII